MTSHDIALLLVDLALVLLLARLFGLLARRLRQPPVVGEIVIGILLGPTLLHGSLTRSLFPTGVRPPLTSLSDLGIALFMFIVGLELDHTLLLRRRAAAVSVAVGSMLVPFGLGLLAALTLAHQQPAGHRLGFVLFMGTAMSVTAFPVLARIITDRGLARTPVGTLSLGGAAVCDVLAWSMLAVVIAVAGPDGRTPWRVALVVPFVVGAVLLGRPLMTRLIGADSVEDPSVPVDEARALTVVLVAVLGGAAFTQWAGLNFIFGAFLVGAVVPRGAGHRIGTAIRDRVESLSMMLLMPVFFVMAGLNVDLTTLGLSGVGTIVLIVVIAVGGKLAGGYAGARVAGVGPRESFVLGALMNTRGLTELVVLATGLQTGVLDHRTYSMMVLMALLTTAMTGPLLDAAGVVRGAVAGPDLHEAFTAQSYPLDARADRTTPVG